MTYPHQNFPILHPHQMPGAKLFANRESMLETLATTVGKLQRGRIAEIGVALGDFSEWMIKCLHPVEFSGFDSFEMHKHPVHWGRQSSEIFGQQTHREFYERRLANTGCEVVCYEGRSDVTVPTCPDSYFDLIYVDAAHTYEEVKVDAKNAMRKLKPGGVLIFNDYIMFDHLLSAPYGVVQVVNELVNEHDWRILGFSLQQHMFCDIAVSSLSVDALTAG